VNANKYSTKHKGNFLTKPASAGFLVEKARERAAREKKKKELERVARAARIFLI
jgi:hypothetical protein